jgi:hypothetical protein
MVQGYYYAPSLEPNEFRGLLTETAPVVDVPRVVIAHAS